ncbi:SURF1 family cytochrome oxidase biogenesis protein [Altererythrobacter arenosus]|uniref:SURF1-like protein n=1 Tax=Altererythrobacter arenosus TaxID=3032592 RepID=A0ABY8FVF8_9SPHN|nr:SURF1 family cytochrome oxidase biogenesis protein [Altererythrobacter sp. CAU 1644]WFL78990.1 SURF1 family cytochrome oxidase biogenesis protein [Altererythrobacter sp. CAU 1644]
MRKLPIFSTIVVLAAAATMVALGVWQLGRAQEKEALLEQYARTETMSSEVAWPTDADEVDTALFRRTTVVCAEVLGVEAKAGTSEAGAKGWAHYASCRLANSNSFADVVLGWSREPQLPTWEGGEVRGVIAPGPRLVASPAQAGLEQVAYPDPKDVPNNHLAYAGQWFFFALTALAIYGLAIRKRIKEQA